MSKENLNLPKTAFSMKANLPQKEPGKPYWAKMWLSIHAGTLHLHPHWQIGMEGLIGESMSGLFFPIEFGIRLYGVAGYTG